MTEERKFAHCAAFMMKGRLAHMNEILFVQDEMEIIIVNSGILEKSPFSWITLLYRFGYKNMTESPICGAISKKYGDLPLTIELDFNVMKWADLYNIKLMKDIFMSSAIDAMIFVAKKFKYPPDYFVVERAKYGPIPETVEECERLHNDHPENHLIILYESGIEQANMGLREILNNEESFRRLKKYVHKIPEEMMINMIKRRLRDSKGQKSQCDELLEIMNARTSYPA